VPVTRIIFDVLHSGRKDLAGSPYVLRRALLEDLGLQVPGSVQVPPAFPGDAAALLAATRDQDLEGIVLKRPASLYHSGRRTREWLKIRNIRAAQVRVGGWLPGTGAPEYSRFSAHGPAPARRAGVRGHRRQRPVDGRAARADALLQSAEQPVSPFTGPLPPDITRQARWTRPVLAAEVTYTERTPSGWLRQPVWRGPRPG